MYRFKGGENREEFNQIVQASFPQLLSIGSRLVDETNPEGWEMLRIVLKTFKHTIYVGLNKVCIYVHGLTRLVRSTATPYESEQYGRMVHLFPDVHWEGGSNWST